MSKILIAISTFFLPQVAHAEPRSWEVAPRIEAAPTQPLKQAVRLTPPVVQSGLRGMPLALNLTGCEEMEFYRIQFGLPPKFNKVGWRESTCRNDVRTWCCYGYWQNFLSSHLKARAYYDRIVNYCQVTQVSDIYGIAPLQKQKQACVTMVVFEKSGYQPWALTS